MEELSAVLADIEAAKVSQSPADLSAAYLEIRPHLDRLVRVLAGAPGELPRVGEVIDNLLAGADAITGTPDGT